MRAHPRYHLINYVLAPRHARYKCECNRTGYQPGPAARAGMPCAFSALRFSNKTSSGRKGKSFIASPAQRYGKRIIVTEGIHPYACHTFQFQSSTLTTGSRVRDEFQLYGRRSIRVRPIAEQIRRERDSGPFLFEGRLGPELNGPPRAEEL